MHVKMVIFYSGNVIFSNIIGLFRFILKNILYICSVNRISYLFSNVECDNQSNIFENFETKFTRQVDEFFSFGIN